ncbi:MAG: NAD(P)H-binding protein [Planctomycetes bacterium]|jgi:putative NADH-flavin reductase|nr:NAD(P)H-binding protein [Planctomycetota bacterium]
MHLALIGAAGRTGAHLISEALRRGHTVAAVCRDASRHRLDAYADDPRVTVFAAPVVSDRAMLDRALAGCDAAVAIPISAGQLKAPDLIDALAAAGRVHGVKRFAFTAGEITAGRDPGERYTLRQRLMFAVFAPIMLVTPYSLTGMIEAGRRIRRHDWDWTIVRAPWLTDAPAAGYRLGDLAGITRRDSLARADYAAALLDCLTDPAASRRSRNVTTMTCT